ncbi:uncharacterized protein LOC125520301 isoform X2 [Triticum urartu]|uniref:uncharacterized protein LOC125520301 isoform X2 n=1 Tax=Triticum urartu TaxID=4572 RepID=UPI0020430586|nr:uncharacterized protein LOC125520301 isoform X2 [Triticum urartu]
MGQQQPKLVNVPSAAVLDRRGQGSALSRSKNVRQCQVCKRQDPSAVQEIKGSIIDSAPVAVPNFQPETSSKKLYMKENERGSKTAGHFGVREHLQQNRMLQYI